MSIISCKKESVRFYDFCPYSSDKNVSMFCGRLFFNSILCLFQTSLIECSWKTMYFYSSVYLFFFLFSSTVKHKRIIFVVWPYFCVYEKNQQQIGKIEKKTHDHHLNLDTLPCCFCDKTTVTRLRICYIWLNSCRWYQSTFIIYL